MALNKAFPKEPTEKDRFLDSVQITTRNLQELSSLAQLTSRVTSSSISFLEDVHRRLKFCCEQSHIPTTGVFLRKTSLSVWAFRYFLCNTAFESQTRLAEDPEMGKFVGAQPAFAPYLFLEVTWQLNFEGILAETLLHLPVDLAVELLETLPRAVDLLEFEREARFLMNAVQNVYRKLILLRDEGSQSKDIVGSARKMSGNLQELLVQFYSERFLKLTDIPKSERCKRYGILLKLIMQMVRYCLMSKSKKIELPEDLVKMYKLTFGSEPCSKLDNSVLQELLSEIDRELMTLLLRKVKEIDCNIYMDWTEHDDEENTSLTLQRAIGLEAYHFIQITQASKEFDSKDYKHLVDCLNQIASKPDPNNSLESLQLADLSHGASEGRVDCLLALFRRYKQWDDCALDALDSNVNLLTKANVETLLEILAQELRQANLDAERLQSYCLLLAKAMANLKITELYELTVGFVLKHQSDEAENAVDVAGFQRFVSLNPDLSSAKNFRVVLFFLCMDARQTLKILLKMTIGHSDFPDVAINVDDLMLLVPVLKIQTQSKYWSLIDSLTDRCMEKAKEWKAIISENQILKTNLPEKPKSVSVVLRVLQEIVLEGPGWSGNKFSSLLVFVYTFCPVSEVITEVFVPFLRSELCSVTYLKYILVELFMKLGKYDVESTEELIKALEIQGTYLLKSNHVSRYVADELLSLIIDIIDHLLRAKVWRVSPSFSDRSRIFLGFPFMDHDNTSLGGRMYTSLKSRIGLFTNLHQSKLTDLIKYPIALSEEDVLRQLFLKCTKKQYLSYLDEMLNGQKKFIRHLQSTAEYCDFFVRLTFETCLLCLEFPEVGPPDTTGFLIRRLMHFLSLIVPPKKKKNKFLAELCKNLDTHAAIFKESIARTAIADAYDELLKECTECNYNFAAYLKTYEQFALRSIQKSESLKVFEGPHSPLGLKLRLAYNITNAALEDGETPEVYMKKLGDYFESKE